MSARQTKHVITPTILYKTLYCVNLCKYDILCGWRYVEVMAQTLCGATVQRFRATEQFINRLLKIYNV